MCFIDFNLIESNLNSIWSSHSELLFFITILYTIKLVHEDIVCLSPWTDSEFHCLLETWSTKGILLWRSIGILCKWVVWKWVGITEGRPGKWEVVFYWNKNYQGDSAIREFLVVYYLWWGILLFQWPQWKFVQFSLEWRLSYHLPLESQLVGCRIIYLVWIWVSDYIW